MSSGDTRLDRLFALLENGTNPETRKAAAKQIGEVQKIHPHELHSLLRRCQHYLCSRSWETRTAAGHAISAIVENVPRWNEEPKSGEMGEDDSVAEGLLSFSSFDIEKVLKNGAPLLSSGGSEFDIPASELSMDPKERLQKQRKLMEAKMGLDEAIDTTLSDLIDIDDVVSARSTVETDIKRRREEKDKHAKELAKALEAKGLSARERAKLKREQRMMAQSSANDKMMEKRRRDGTAGSDVSSRHKQKRRKKVKTTDQKDENMLMLEDEWDVEASMKHTSWPFDWICMELSNHLLDPVWEVRHGAGVGLRAILAVHAAEAGMAAWQETKEKQREANRAWLEDCCVRLVCVLALDRFGDYVGDRAVSPVRETSAQVLAAVVRHMPEEIVSECVTALLELQDHEEWHVRHGGLLGLKYAQAVRQDLLPTLLRRTLPPMVQGITDTDDDVRAVAADGMLPIADDIVRLLSNEARGTVLTCKNSNEELDLTYLLKLLWDTLLVLDDLTASTNSVMMLLRELLAHPLSKSSFSKLLHSIQPSKDENSPICTLIPRLYPFLRHNVGSVRLSVLNTIHWLLELDDSVWLGVDCMDESTDVAKAYTWIGMLGEKFPRFIFQNFVLEDLKASSVSGCIVSMSHSVWERMLNRYPPSFFSATYHELWAHCVSLCATPLGVQPKASLILLAKFPSCDKETHDGDIGDKKKRKGLGLSALLSMRPASTMDSRIDCAKALGFFCHIAQQHGLSPQLETSLQEMVVSNSSSNRQLAALTIEEWMQHSTTTAQDVPGLRDALHHVLVAQTPTYSELQSYRENLTEKYKVLVASMEGVGLQISQICPSGDVLINGHVHPDEALLLARDRYPILIKQARRDAEWEATKEQLDARCKRVVVAVGAVEVNNNDMHHFVCVSAAGALIALQYLPQKLNPVIRSIMNGIKQTQDATLQQRCARSVAGLLQICRATQRKPDPSSKVTKNLCGFIVSDRTRTPLIGSYRPSTALEVPTFSTNVADAKSLARRGGEFAVRAIMDTFGDGVFAASPTLWDSATKASASHRAFYQDEISQELDRSPEDVQLSAISEEQRNTLQCLVDTLGVAEVLVEAECGHKTVRDMLLELFAHLLHMCTSAFADVRVMAARVTASFCHQFKLQPMVEVIRVLLPHLSDTQRAAARLGAACAINYIIARMGNDIVPYTAFLAVPLMGRMSDENEYVRRAVTRCFAAVVQLVPLEAGTPDPEGLPEDLKRIRTKERCFLEQLLDGSKLTPYRMPLKLKGVQLRSYQQDGLNWLNFLRQYQLHGILCDDMGLGKTLQTLCIIAGDTHERRCKFAETRDVDCKPLPSLVVCPPTVVGHWHEEIEKFFGKHLRPFMYIGNKNERAAMQSKITGRGGNKHPDVIILSYEILRNDVDFLSTFSFNYCVLDEGHIIKNSKSKIACAAKKVHCNHRLILSGTPIQNNVLELWSLFDFLMPGFLGSESSFKSRYGKPLQAVRANSKTTAKQQEDATLALEALHRQVLPFLLRRLKEDVLADLPPKIIQDYHCNLTPLQEKLYEDFATSAARQGISEELDTIENVSESIEDKKVSSHVFQALQYLRKLCDHPLLVLSDKHPQYSKILPMLGDGGLKGLHDIQQCPKLMALRQLLKECGIGAADKSGGAVESAIVSHRCLIFAQFKSMLDLVENDLFKRHMPNLSYLRLDGSVKQQLRHGIVTKFNANPSIDVLLLTTHVGGLGLNLTGADTVIFLEHDWNPMKDLQAMDRAHRLGQRKVVNVYRLITRGTLEEKIMSLQQFKLNVANSVINADNSSLRSMDTNQLLDLFNLSCGEEAKKTAATSQEDDGVDVTGALAKRPRKGPSTGLKAMMEQMEELWDESQYEEEYDVGDFLKSLQ